MEFQFIGPDDVPDEIKEQMAAMMDRQQMGLQTVAHDVQRLFRELNEDQLSTLRFLIHTIAHNQEAGFYYEGVLATLYAVKANVCQACGKDHDQEMADAMHPAGGETLPNTLPNTVSRVEAALRAANGGELPSDTGAALNRLMIEYNMRPANEKQDGSEDGAVCLGCGTRYVSLEDRMIQPPGAEGCSPCQQKAKWG